MVIIDPKPDVIPKAPDRQVFGEYPPLVSLCKCWEDARGKAMLPTKQDFERVMLDYPEILPNLAMVQFVSPDEFSYSYIGSKRVQRRNKDETNHRTEDAFAPDARDFLAAWTKAGLDKPHVTFWQDQTELPSGTIAESSNLSVILSGDSGVPNCIAVMTVADEAYSRELVPGGFLVGSAGLRVTPVDIGFGIPDLPTRLV